MTDGNDWLTRYQARRWRAVPVHRPDPDRRCTCGNSACPKPGKHPVPAFWPGGSTDPADYENRNVGVKLGPDSNDVADVDLDCGEAVTAGAYLLPPTDSAFGRGGRMTHWLYTVPARDSAYAKLSDPVLSGDTVTIVELRWPGTNDDASPKNLQTVFPPSLHQSGETLSWFRDGDPSSVRGGDLGKAVRHVAAAVLIARYAKP